MTLHMDPFASLQQRISRRHFALHLLAIAVATQASSSQGLVAQDSPTPETKVYGTSHPVHSTFNLE